MTLTEVLSSNVEITRELLRNNTITEHEVIKNRELGDINPERYLDILYTFESISRNDYLKFLIMYFNIKIKNYEEAYKYVTYLYKNGVNYKNDAALYMLMLEELLGYERSQFNIYQVLLKNYDERFYNVFYRNKIRTNIFNKKYEQAHKEIKKIFGGETTISDGVVYSLLKAIREKGINKALDCIERLDIEGLNNYLSTKNCESGTNKVQATMCDILADTLYGYPVGKKGELPQSYDIYDLVEARDIDKIIKCNNDRITVAIAKKIKEIEEQNIIDDYKGNLSSLVYDTLERVYSCIQSKNFTLAEEIICEYLDSIEKDSWVFYICNRLLELEASYDTLSEDEVVLKVGEIFDLIVEVSRPMSEEVETALIEKHMGQKDDNHPYSKIHDIDVEFNYNIEGIDDLIANVKDNTVSYEDYATLPTYKEEDLFKIAIMARENYRMGRTQLGDALISIVEDLTKKSTKKSSEIRFFVKAIKNNRKSIEGHIPNSFVDQVKMLLR